MSGPTDIFARLEQLLAAALADLGAPADAAQLERPATAAHGDYATGAALRLAKQLKRPPRAIAEELAAALAADEMVAAAEVAGPGFVNLRLAPAARTAVVGQALQAGDAFGAQPPSGRKVLLEFVSSNPTGPLHIGHGRAAALGDSLARIMRHAGDEVHAEYYLNDRGLQTDVLAASLWLRVVMLDYDSGRIMPSEANQGAHLADDAVLTMPPGAYQGTYLDDVAGAWRREHAETELPTPNWKELAALEPGREAGAQLAAAAQAALGKQIGPLRDYAIASMRKHIEAELKAFSVTYDEWRSERELDASGAIADAVEMLKKAGHTYEQDGALWFRASELGDEKDRVLVRANGELTYFAADVAYHMDKAERCDGLLLSLFGADHHGYVPRLRAAWTALGEEPKRLEFGIIQFVALVNAGERVRMSTRAGEFVLLSDLIKAVGADAARLYYVLAKGEVSMDFDLKRATTHSKENPIYYLQYAHVRSCSLLEKWGGKKSAYVATKPEHLADEHAQRVLAELNWFAPALRQAARQREPHRIAHWLIALASVLHGYYDHVPVLGGDQEGLPARLALVAATRQALANGLALLGIQAPTKM